MTLHPNTQDETGKRYGRLVVEEPVSASNRGVKWKCRCDCGQSHNVLGVALRQGQVSSCGCLRADLGRAMLTKHGLYKSPGYNSWWGAKMRCRNPRNQHYWRYGGAGIAFSPAWDKFEDFIEDMGLPPSPRHSIDRIDGRGNYEPGNCRWATQQEQIWNRNTTIWITHDGERLPVREWARRSGVHPATLRKRLRDGWSIVKALIPPATFLCLLALPVYGQTQIKHGPLLRQSDDYIKSPELQQGCVMRFDKALDRSVCVGQLAVALSVGKQTVVSNVNINGLSRVRCGCLLDGYESATACNESAAWLGRIRVTSVAKGTFTINHSYAIGTESIRCSWG